MSEPLLEVKNLHKSFGAKSVHCGVSLALHEKEILGLFGGSGTGKSVFLRSLIGLDSPDSGSIFFRGREITDLSEKEWVSVRIRIGYVFQNGALFDSLTVEENLAYPLIEHTTLSDEEILKRVNAMLELIDMRGSNDLLPAELSGGMQKRAGLARATILEPEVILFDEPTAGLDPTNTKRLLTNIHRIKERGKMAGIFVTHDIPSAFEICDRIAILHEGKIHVVAPVSELKQSKDPVVLAFIDEALK